MFPCFIEMPFLNANCVVPDQTPRSIAFDLGFHCTVCQYAFYEKLRINGLIYVLIFFFWLPFECLSKLFRQSPSLIISKVKCDDRLFVV